MKCLRIELGLAALLLFGPWSGADAVAAEVGRIISLTPETSVLRDGRSIPLELSSPVFDTDTLITGEGGRARVLFDDDSSVSLGANTSLSLESVDLSGDEPRFEARLDRGAARFLTGKSQETKPDSFSVATSDAIITPRGRSSMFSVQASVETPTVVHVFNAENGMGTAAVLVNSVPLAPGFQMTVSENRPRPMDGGDWNGVAAATRGAGYAPVMAGLDATLVAGTGIERLMETAALLQPDTKVQTLAQLDELAAEREPIIPPPANFNAHVSGTLTSSHVPALIEGGNSFSFDVNLNPHDGRVSNATMRQYLLDTSNNPVKFNYDLINGSGLVSNGSALISGFESRPGSSFTIDGTTVDPSNNLNASMQVNGLNSGAGGSVTGSYEVGSISPAVTPDSGSLSGTITPVP